MRKNFINIIAKFHSFVLLKGCSMKFLICATSKYFKPTAERQDRPYDFTS